MNNYFGLEFPPNVQKWRAVFPAGSQANITTKQYILGTFTLNPGYYLVNWEGAITKASGMNNNNIHLIISQNTTPDPNLFSQFAFQAMPEWNNGTSILATSMTDIIHIVGITPVSVYLYDTQAGGTENYDFQWESVKVTPIKFYA